jgi:hypothetical protein
MTLTARNLESMCNNSVVRGDMLNLVNLFFKKNRKITRLNLENAVFKGDLDFGLLRIGDIRIDHCKVEGVVTGTITYYREIYLRHPHIWYWDNYCEKTLASSQIAEFFAQRGY